MSKPRIRYNSNKKLCTCYLPQDKEAHWVYIIGWGDTPEEAYWDLMERKAAVRKKYQPTPEPLINITYLDPEEMLPEWESSYIYGSGQSVLHKGKVYKLCYLADKRISSINEAPDVSYPWICQSGLNTKYKITKTSLVEDKPKRWWEFWK